MTKSTESGVDTLWQWDAAGNLTRRATTGGETWEYLWDARDKMTKVRKQPYGGAMADVAAYSYDAMGRRFQKTAGANTTTYYQDGLTPVVEAKANLTKRHRAFEGDLGNVVQTVDGANNTFYAYDARLGNVVATFGSDGRLKQSYTSYGMEAFGNVYAGNPENFGITTKQLDTDTGLYYFNARWYEGESGRFISAASMKRTCEHPYGIVDDNPLSSVDYTGNAPTAPSGPQIAACAACLLGLLGGQAAGCAWGCRGAADYGWCVKDCMKGMPGSYVFQISATICGVICSYPLDPPDDSEECPPPLPPECIDAWVTYRWAQQTGNEILENAMRVRIEELCPEGSNDPDRPNG